MTDKTDIDTSLKAMDWAIIGGFGALTIGSIYVGGLGGATLLFTIATLAILAVSLWLFLTDHEKFADYVRDNQLMATIGLCLVTFTSFLYMVILQSNKFVKS